MLIYWLPALLWLLVVGLFSSQSFGGEHTQTVLEEALKWLDLKLSAGEMAALHYGIRKTAHFVAYGVLSALFFRAARGPLPETMWKMRWALLAMAICLVTSSSDELHQFFTPGRTGTYRDVLLDLAGALFAQLLILIVYLGKAGRRPRAPREA